MRLERRTKCRAVTLIEMLIVVAMMSLMAAGTLSVITAPMREQVISGAEAAAEAGASGFFSKLVSDAHAARELVPLPDSRGVRLMGAASDGSDVIYVVDANSRLRRAMVPAGVSEVAPGLGAALLDDVAGVDVQQVPESGLWRITLRAGRELLGRNLRLERSMELGVGTEFFAGGAR